MNRTTVCWMAMFALCKCILGLNKTDLERPEPLMMLVHHPRHCDLSRLSRVQRITPSRRLRLCSSNIGRSLSLSRQTFDAWPDHSLDKLYPAVSVALCMWQRFKREDEASFLDEALNVCFQGFQDSTLDPTAISEALLLLLNVVLKKSKQTDSGNIFETVIAMLENFLCKLPEDHDSRWNTVDAISRILPMKFAQDGQFNAIEDKFVSLYQSAVSSYSSSELQKVEMMQDLVRIFQTSMPHDIFYVDKGIGFYKQAISLCNTENLKVLASVKMALALAKRYLAFDTVKDLDTASEIVLKALAQVPEEIIQAPEVYAISGDMFEIKHGYSGELEDLDHSIQMCRKDLQKRFNQCWQMEDLNQTIITLYQAKALLPKENYQMQEVLQDLGDALFQRFQRFQRINDLHAAIDIYCQLLALWPVGHHMRVIALSQVVKLLQARYLKLRNPNDLDNVLILAKEHISLQKDVDAFLQLANAYLQKHLITQDINYRSTPWCYSS
ncbi:unnamed protein product [Somion occarium]|uniref:Uncharacterized protein n=1 Tax=Somion occarium TaxID=3059160 RepID=A0ABP1DRV9_9APHY